MLLQLYSCRTCNNALYTRCSC